MEARRHRSVCKAAAHILHHIQFPGFRGLPVSEIQARLTRYDSATVCGILELPQGLFIAGGAV